MTKKLDAYDRWWKWATKPVESTRKISAEIHRAVMELPEEDRRDREKVNAAVRDASPPSPSKTPSARQPARRR